MSEESLDMGQKKNKNFKTLLLPFASNFIIHWFYFDYSKFFEGINTISNFIRLKLLKWYNFKKDING